MIAILDYGMGNLKSVFNALDYLGQDAVVTSEKNIIHEAERLILPGVGSFGDAMQNLNEHGLTDIIHGEVREKKKPFLGICLGMQLLADTSYEYGLHSGLGLIGGEVRPLDVEKSGLKVPHVGWNDIATQNVDSPLFKNLYSQETSFYFVHSYHFVPARKENILATCDYGITFTAAVQKENVTGFQFHPEKSQDNGLQVLENFVNWRP